MSLLKIARMGHPVLRRRALPIDDPTAPEVKALARDMVETMADAAGIGLAAPQVHVGRRLIVFRLPPDAGEEPDAEDEDESPQVYNVTALANPEIEPLGDEIVRRLEGCLSIPGLRGVVPRHAAVRYRGTTPFGDPIEREAIGLHARVVQHEVDHLDGVLFLDRMTDLTTLVFESEMRHLRTDDDEDPDDGEDPGDDGDEVTA